MRNQRNAILWALVSWLVRRRLRQRTAATVAGITGAGAGHGRLRGVLGAFALVGVIAGAFVVWRRLGAGETEEWETAVDVAPVTAPSAEPIPA